MESKLEKIINRYKESGVDCTLDYDSNYDKEFIERNQGV